ncbi:MAG TPA: hypothetical protein VL966_15340 [Alphaproteobacteria bacterium]|jgi:hypothetical protein|nr:hypothetical protein [Alphaproteobacteria bacterium]
MANARLAPEGGGRTRKGARTGVVSTHRKRKVVRKSSAEMAPGSDRKEPYPVRQTRK